MSDTVTQIVLYAAILLTGLLLGHYLPAYYGRKGKNRADKEDAGAITTEKEVAKDPFTRGLEQQTHEHALERDAETRRHQLRMACIDKRFQAHQEAYALWWKLRNHVHDAAKIGGVVLECQQWWVNNNLYLEPDVRVAFYTAYTSANNHGNLVLVGRGKANPDLTRAVTENWQRVSAPGHLLVKATSLPPLDEAADDVTRPKQGATPDSK